MINFLSRPTWLVGVVLTLAIAPITAMSAVFHVDASASGSGTGASWADAFNDLQPAIEASQEGDEVWVAAGIYYPTTEVGGTGERFRAFQLKNVVSVYGGFEGDETSLDERDWQANVCVLSGDLGVPDDNTDNSLHVIHHPPGFILDSRARLDGFTITGGHANLAGGDSRKGGGMYNEDAEPTVINCRFVGNRAAGSSYARGGAMYNHYCSPAIVDCEFIDNFCDSSGGAIYNAGYSAEAAAPFIRGCLFQGNSAGVGGNGDGGAIYNSTACEPTIVDCRFIGNSAQYNGGAIRNYGGGGGGYLVNCVFSDNSAGLYGGVLYNGAGTVLTAANCVFNRSAVTAGNGHGGAVYNTACDPVFVGCVFHDNESGCVGQGVYNIQFADAVFTNCILQGDWVLYNGGDCDVQVTWCCMEQEGYEAPELHNIYADPMMVDPANDDFHLQPGSPCIDAGNNLALPLDVGDLDGDDDRDEVLPLDMDGDPRCQDDADAVDNGHGEPPYVDIGVDEISPSIGVDDVPMPASDLALSCHPNPFNPRAAIGFQMRDAGAVELRIYAVDGTLVRTLRTVVASAGRHELIWDGLDQAGRDAVSGVYLCRVWAGGRSSQISVALVR